MDTLSVLATLYCDCKLQIMPGRSGRSGSRPFTGLGCSSGRPGVQAEYGAAETDTDMMHEFKRDLLLGTSLVPMPRLLIYGSSRLFYGESPAKQKQQSEASKTYSTAYSILQPDLLSEAEVKRSTGDLVSCREQHLHTDLRILLPFLIRVPSSS